MKSRTRQVVPECQWIRIQRVHAVVERAASEVRVGVVGRISCRSCTKSLEVSQSDWQWECAGALSEVREVGVTTRRKCTRVWSGVVSNVRQA